MERVIGHDNAMRVFTEGNYLSDGINDPTRKKMKPELHHPHAHPPPGIASKHEVPGARSDQRALIAWSASSATTTL